MKKKILASIMALNLFGCATSKNPNDPYENYNRKVFAFNMAADHYVLRPIAVGYTYVPEPIRIAISNFYNNLRDFVTLGNDILQLNGPDTMHNTMRIALNSTFGILGIIDVSSSLGLPQTQTTFGDTMKRWGWKNSSYFLLPFLGPGTIRDDIGIAPDIYFNPLFWITSDEWISWTIFSLNLINQRAMLLDQDKLLMSSIDPYATIRDIYLQRNGSYIYPNYNESSSLTSSNDNIDELISEENRGTSPKSQEQKSDDSGIDALIDEENQGSSVKQQKANTQDLEIDALIDEENQALKANQQFSAPTSSATIVSPKSSGN